MYITDKPSWLWSCAAQRIQSSKKTKAARYFSPCAVQYNSKLNPSKDSAQETQYGFFAPIFERNFESQSNESEGGITKALIPGTYSTSHNVNFQNFTSGSSGSRSRIAEGEDAGFSSPASVSRLQALPVSRNCDACSCNWPPAEGYRSETLKLIHHTLKHRSSDALHNIVHTQWGEERVRCLFRSHLFSLVASIERKIANNAQIFRDARKKKTNFSTNEAFQSYFLQPSILATNADQFSFTNLVDVNTPLRPWLWVSQQFVQQNRGSSGVAWNKLTRSPAHGDVHIFPNWVLLGEPAGISPVNSVKGRGCYVWDLIPGMLPELSNSALGDSTVSLCANQFLCQFLWVLVIFSWIRHQGLMSAECAHFRQRCQTFFLLWSWGKRTRERTWP